MLLTHPTAAPELDVKQIGLPADDISDEYLIQQVKQGNTHTYGSIMRRYNQRMFRVARSIVKNDADALDIVQEAHIKAYTKINDYRGDNKFAAWLAAITRNEALMHLRKSKREVTMQENEIDMIDMRRSLNSLEKNLKHVPSPEFCLQNKELKALINNTIDELPDDFRIVFVLRAIEQFSVKETADILSINPQTVKSRLYRAKRLLRSAIQSTFEQAGMRVYEVGGEHCDSLVYSVLTHIRQRQVDKRSQTPS